MEDAMEQVDIGGPTMVRAAAKNHKHVGIVVDPSDYSEVLRSIAGEGLGADLRSELALKGISTHGGLRQRDCELVGPQSVSRRTAAGVCHRVEEDCIVKIW